MPPPQIGIVGAGVVGLTMGINLLKEIPTAKVTLYADKFEKDTTSYGAGGIFRPNAEHLHGVDADTVIRWSTVGFKYFSSFATSPEAGATGHMIMPGYVFSNTQLDPLYKTFVYSFKELTPTDLQKLGVKYKYGYQVTTIITDCSRYIPWLMKTFQAAGGTIIQRTIKSLEEFVGSHDVVVNCSGIGARELVGDKSVYPVRGHLIRLKAPWIKYWVYTEDSAYIVPAFDTVAIGGIRQKDNFSLDVDTEDSRGIQERCGKLWPSLKGAEVVREWVGLRPHREPPRIERETMSFEKGQLQVVHHYGLGALGITLAYGTSLDATKLVLQALQQSSSKL